MEISDNHPLDIRGSNSIIYFSGYYGAFPTTIYESIRGAISDGSKISPI